MNINSNTNTICLLGHPIKHSFSPTIHNYLFEKYSENNIYVCFDVKEDKLKETQFDLPYSMKLAKELDKLGVHIKDRMTMEGMVDELCQLHLKK